MAADAFFPVVDAKYDLGVRSALPRRPATVIVRQGVDQPVAVMVLVGVLPQRAAHRSRQGVQRFQQPLQISQRQRPDLAARQAQMLRQPKQAPRAAVHGMAVGLRRYRTVQPGPDHIRQGIPGAQRRVLFRQFPRPAGQIFRQLSGIQGMSRQCFRWSGGEISAQGRQRACNSPVLLALMRNPQSIQPQPHRQIIDQRDRRFPIGRIGGMLLPPVHHPRPAGQFQRQPTEIPVPARFGNLQPPQFGDDRLHRIIRPAGQRRATV